MISVFDPLPLVAELSMRWMDGWMDELMGGWVGGEGGVGGLVDGWIVKHDCENMTSFLY